MKFTLVKEMVNTLWWKFRKNEIEYFYNTGFITHKEYASIMYKKRRKRERYWIQERELLLPDDVVFTFCFIPSGDFMMGSPLDEPGRSTDELLHRVRISKGFWLGKYPVTQLQWEALMGSNPSEYVVDDHPVEMVSHPEALEYCAKLTKLLQQDNEWQTDWKCTLPTEAQWEYACRGGSSRMYNTMFKDCSNKLRIKRILNRVAWYHENSRELHHPVGEKLPNDFGLYDMHGNVCEWCLDGYAQYSSGFVVDPVGPLLLTENDTVPVRGGSHLCGMECCRSANRHRAPTPSHKCKIVGFRVACV